MTENRRKQHKRKWESKKAATLWERYSPLSRAPMKETALQGIVDELEEARDLIKVQETQIESLRNEIAETREGTTEQECSRVKAEVYRANAENETRVLKATIAELRKILEDKGRGDEALVNIVSRAESSIKSPQKSKVTSTCDVESTPVSKESSDQGYFSMPRQSLDVSPKSPALSSSHQLSLLQSTGLEFQQQYNCKMESVNAAKEYCSCATSTDNANSKAVTVGCQTDLLGSVIANSFFMKNLVLTQMYGREELPRIVSPTKPQKYRWFMFIFSHSFFIVSLLQGCPQSMLDVVFWLKHLLVPCWRPLFTKV